MTTSTNDQIRQFAFIYADTIDDSCEGDTYANVYKAFIAGYNKCLEEETDYRLSTHNPTLSKSGDCAGLKS